MGIILAQLRHVQKCIFFLKSKKSFEIKTFKKLFHVMTKFRVGFLSRPNFQDNPPLPSNHKTFKNNIRIFIKIIQCIGMRKIIENVENIVRIFMKGFEKVENFDLLKIDIIILRKIV